MTDVRAFDDRVFALINGWAGRNGPLDLAMEFWARHAPVFLAALLALLWIAWKPRLQMGAFLAAGSAFLALGVGQVLGKLFPRPRPFAAPGMPHVHLLIPHVADASFPSDHATLAFALTTVLWRVDRRLGVVLLLLSVWLMIARVFVGHHFPSDVLGGAVLGGLTAWAILRIAPRRPLSSLIVWIFTLLQRRRLAARGSESAKTVLEDLTHA